MNVRKAKIQDLNKLTTMYESIIKNMLEQEINIWQIFNPIDFFKEDIKNQRIYLLEDTNQILGAFTIFEFTKGAKYIEWQNENATPIYISRLGVNPLCQKQGIGSILMHHIKNIAKEKQANSIRLLVVDINQPAIDFYTKNGFTRSTGLYNDIINENTTFIEYGYEFNLL